MIRDRKYPAMDDIIEGVCFSLQRALRGQTPSQDDPDALSIANTPILATHPHSPFQGLSASHRVLAARNDRRADD